MIRGNTLGVNLESMSRPLPAWRTKLLGWLRHQTESPVRALKRFTTGGFLFAAGMMVLLLAARLMPAGLAQEWVVLFGLAVTLLGGLYALSGYLAISLFRILRYLLEPHE